MKKFILLFIFTFAMSHGAKAANFTFVNSSTAGYNIAVGTIHTATITSVSAGDFVELWLTGEANSGQATVTVADDVNGSWTQVSTNVTNGAVRFGATWYFMNSKAGALHVTATSSVATYMGICISDYQALNPTGVLVDASISNAPAGNVTVIHTATVTISGTGELIVGGMGQGNAQIITTTVDSPFTLRANQPNGISNESAASCDDNNPLLNEECVFRISSTVSNVVAMAVSFKMTPASTGPTTDTIYNGKLFNAIIQ